MSSDDGYKLFVGSLPADCTSEELHAVFSTYGVVTHVHVMNPHPRSGQRCAFVFYTTKAAGDDACKVLDNQYRIRTDAAQPIVVRWSKDSGFDAAANGDCEDGPRRSDPPEDGHKLFVGNLPADLSEEELRLVFGTYGEVVHCHIMSIHPKSGLRCAFVYYRDLQSAEAAIQLLDNEYRIREKAMEPIQVRWANKDSERERKGKGDKGDLQNAWRGDLQNARGDWITMSDRKGKGDGWDRREWSNGKGLPAKGKDMYSDWFPGTKGGSKGWHPPWEDRSWEKGFGKDRWGDWDEGWAWNSWESAKGSKGSKGNWQGDGWSKGWSFREEGKGKAGKMPSYGKGWKGYEDGVVRPSEGFDETGTKLYVANLPEDIQESALEYVFGTYGTVEKVHVMRGKVKNGCISGFVEFENPDEATTAIMSLDNKYEIRAGYGPLQVRLANAKRY